METEKPRARAGLLCPTLGKDMSKVCHTCPLWTKIVGKNPQSEEHIERWDCAWALLPLLLVENSQQQRQTAAAVESFRNETERASIRVAHASRATAQSLAEAIVATRRTLPPGAPQ